MPPRNDSTCTDCGADWAAEEHTDGCAQCGGAALAAPCPVCLGRCGAMWTRQVIDSQDAHEAHWMGACALPEDERRAAYAARVREQSD